MIKIPFGFCKDIGRDNMHARKNKINIKASRSMADKLPCSLINPKTQIQEYCLGNPSEGVQVVDLQIHHQTPTFDHQNG